MTKARLYDTVLLLEDIGSIPKGAKGAVVEVYTTPYEAYDIEVVTDAGSTEGLAEAVRPQQIQVIGAKPESVRLTSVRIADDGSRADVSFSDGTEVSVEAVELYARKG
jgi:Domain of unknown function (DUF4926)